MVDRAKMNEYMEKADTLETKVGFNNRQILVVQN